jgi:hypothetical protein
MISGPTGRCISRFLLRSIVSHQGIGPMEPAVCSRGGRRRVPEGSAASPRVALGLHITCLDRILGLLDALDQAGHRQGLKLTD